MQRKDGWGRAKDIHKYICISIVCAKRREKIKESKQRDGGERERESGREN